MRRFVRAGLAVVTAVGTMAPAHAQSGHYMVVGIGISSCGHWTEVRKLGADSWPAMNIASWVAGYVTAINRVKAGSIVGRADVEAIDAWIDNYCAAHPLDDVAKATDMLVVELKKRNQG